MIRTLYRYYVARIDPDSGRVIEKRPASGWFHSLEQLRRRVETDPVRWKVWVEYKMSDQP